MSRSKSFVDTFFFSAKSDLTLVKFVLVIWFLMWVTVLTCNCNDIEFVNRVKRGSHVRVLEDNLRLLFVAGKEEKELQFMAFVLCPSFQ